MTRSPSSASLSQHSAVTPARVYGVLREAEAQLGEAVAAMHATAGRQRAYSVAQALRDDADALALTRRAVRWLLEDLESQRRADVASERARILGLVPSGGEEAGSSEDEPPAPAAGRPPRRLAPLRVQLRRAGGELDEGP